MFRKLAYDQDDFSEKTNINARTGRTKALMIAAAFSLAVMIAAQIIMIIRFNGQQVSDGHWFTKKALFCAENGLWYPSAEHISSRYFSANGLINLMALLFRLGAGLRTIYVINALLVQVMLWSCVFIVYRVARSVGFCCRFIVLFCLLNTMWGYVVIVNTEIMFNALAFLGIALLFSEKRLASVACGLLLALANWVRPLGLIFLLGSLLVLVYRKKTVKHFVGVIAGFCAVVAVIGCVSLRSGGYFVYQATTSGINLIQTANDDADGSYMDEVFNEGKAGYIPEDQQKEMTFKDFDRVYRERGLDWIRQHPFKYLSQIPRKLFLLYATETYSGNAYFNNEVVTSGKEYIIDVVRKIMGRADEPLAFGDILVVADQAWYSLIMVLALIGLVRSLMNNKWRFLLPFVFIAVMGTGVAMILISGARYHFPYLPIFIMSAAFAIGEIKKPRKEKDTENGSKV